MSGMYATAKQTLAFFETVAKANPELTFHLRCGFVDRGMYSIGTLEELHDWLDYYQHKEVCIHIQVEGLRGKNTRKQRGGRLPEISSLDSKPKLVEKLKKLWALLDGTPFPEEADVALRKIRDIESRIRQRRNEEVNMDAEVDVLEEVDPKQKKPEPPSWAFWACPPGGIGPLPTDEDVENARRTL